MKPSLQLQIGQHLTMTPQLQQAIRLLQLSTLELEQEIQEALEANPLLEVGDDNDHETETHDIEIDYAAGELALQQANAGDSPMDIQANESIPDQLPVDTVWDDVFSGTSTTGLGSGGDDEDENLLEARNAIAPTLHADLIWQLNLTPFSELDRRIAEALIEAVDERGYLTIDIQDIRETLPHEYANEDLDDAEIEAVLHRIQQFDPPGVCARDLRECLLIQMGQWPDNQPWREKAIELVREYLSILAQHDYPTLQRKLKLQESQLREVIRAIQSLNPVPGSRLGYGSDTDYVTPDVIVRKKNQRWVVELNPDHAPRVRINTNYASLIRRADSSSDNNYLKNSLQEARWFIKSLQSRNETLLKVAHCIVEHQRGFLEDGPESMQPLVLRDVAEEVGMHESTISRVTTQKFMLTPRGLYELKYFFSSHVATNTGGECSSTAIRAMIRKLVGQEDLRKPLSDNKIADLLEAQGISVARRTIAKYRESLNIAPSNERKRLI